MSDVVVWDLEGNRHTMSRPNARDMVTNMGWTNYPPAIMEAKAAADEALAAEQKAAEEEATAKALAEAQEAAEENARKVAAAAEEAAHRASLAAAEREATEKAASESVDQSKLEMEKLVELAKSLGVEVDQRWGKTRLLKEIKDASKGE